ncbi:MAG: hypothetical protein IT456_06140 [Planctomycetes bacterium]|nr:hypothetical protein [Planctomycetota bacterium]
MRLSYGLITSTEPLRPPGRAPNRREVAFGAREGQATQPQGLQAAANEVVVP